MTRRLAHRGPDGEGSFIDSDNRVALSHRRLAIIDRSSLAGQPMISRSGRHAISYNGEIFNAPDMRRSLERRGQTFRTGSDYEVLLESIEACGLEPTLREADGMFALALWDSRDQQLSLARDQLGVKPLHYIQEGKALAFASEIKALACWPDFSGELDPEALGLYLQLGYIPAPLSIYCQVRKIEAGELATFGVDGPVGAKDILATCEREVRPSRRVVRLE